jgi:diguanylate cyclase (GGDEF)-like protein
MCARRDEKSARSDPQPGEPAADHVVVTSGGIFTRDAAATAPDDAGRAAQVALRDELLDSMIQRTPSLDHLAGMVGRHLGAVAELTGVTVYSLESDSGRPLVVAQHGTPPSDAAVAGQVLRRPAGAPPLTIPGGIAVRLRMGGHTLGILELRGTRVQVIGADTIRGMAVTFASTLQALMAEDQRRFVVHASDTIRRLFENATKAADVDEAATLLARSAADAFHTERAALSLIDADGRIRHAIGVGFTPEQSETLARTLVGKQADGSPIWQAAMARRAPVLVDDVADSPGRAGGFVQALGLRTYLAMPLLSAAGPVGMVVCGDVTGIRRWTTRDRDLASSLAVEGSLIMDSAGMRQTERMHVAELTRQAFHDALTGLPNRWHLLDQAEQAVDRATSRGGRAGLLLIDLDGFKSVNDTAGHHAGDLLLRAVGQRLLSAVREGDLVARLGGDEFAILLASDPDESSARAVAARVHRRLCEPFRIEDRDIAIGGSVGIALFPDHAADVAGLIKAADGPMYEAKRNGGGIRSAA